MEWSIIVSIITLVGFGITICSIVSNNTKAMTEVKCSVDKLNESLKHQTEELGKIKDTVGNHEIRIVKLEK